MKILVIGHARHGKDSVSEILRDHHGHNFTSSSWYLAEKVAVPYLAERGIEYPSVQAAYNDRANHRAHWFDAIAAYNKDDPARFGKELFSQFDIYCGCRNAREVWGMRDQKVFDVCFWVDASHRLPPEPKTSMTLASIDADFIINNNGSVDYLPFEVEAVYQQAKEKLGLK